MSGSTGATRAAVLADRYELVRHIARGGMGDVFEATDRQLDRRVAVKQFRGTSADDRPRFEAEILLLAQLNHPGLVQVYDAGEHDGESFVVLELVDGPPLREVLQRRGSVPPDELATFGAALADALAYVHDNGVVHRDVTPANVLCGPDGRPRLADFGIARLLDQARITATSDTIGTAAYMAPEQLEGRDVTTAADIYSLGLVLLEALTGRRAFEGTGAESAMARLARDPDTSTGVPPTWGDLLAAMTARDPAVRPDAATTRDRLAGLAAPRPEHVAPAGAAVIAGVEDATVAAVTPAGADEETAAIPAASAAAGPAPSVDADAETMAIPAGGGTSVMPVALLPDGTATPPSRTAAPTSGAGTARPHHVVWGFVVGLAAVLIVALAAQSGGGIDVPATTVPVVETTVPPTTVAPETTQPPPVVVGDDDDDDEGEGRGGPGGEKGKKDDDD